MYIQAGVGTEKLFEEMIAENIPVLMKTINSQIQEAQWIPSIRNMKKTTLKHIRIKLLKINDEEKFLKVATEKRHIMYRKSKIGMTENSS